MDGDSTSSVELGVKGRSVAVGPISAYLCYPLAQRLPLTTMVAGTLEDATVPRFGLVGEVELDAIARVRGVICRGSCNLISCSRRKCVVP